MAYSNKNFDGLRIESVPGEPLTSFNLTFSVVKKKYIFKKRSKLVRLNSFYIVFIFVSGYWHTIMANHLVRCG